MNQIKLTEAQEERLVILSFRSRNWPLTKEERKELKGLIELYDRIIAEGKKAWNKWHKGE